MDALANLKTLDANVLAALILALTVTIGADSK